MKGNGLRYDAGKIRFDLIPPNAYKELGKILTYGSQKYAPRNWEKGMEWSKVIASLKRHLLAFELGEDRDPESGLLHIAHVMCNAAFLAEYYKIFPQGDDRTHRYLEPPRIGLDIDDVLADFMGAYSNKYGVQEPKFWSFDRAMEERYATVCEDKDFWLSMPVKTKPEDIPFEPTCYVTSRKCPVEWTEEWLAINGFPAVPVYSGVESKVEVCKKEELDYFVDDRYENFVQLNKNGILCFLLSAPHNTRYEVGEKRIDNLMQLKQ